MDFSFRCHYHLVKYPAMPVNAVLAVRQTIMPVRPFDITRTSCKSDLASYNRTNHEMRQAEG